MSPALCSVFPGFQDPSDPALVMDGWMDKWMGVAYEKCIFSPAAFKHVLPGNYNHGQSRGQLMANCICQCKKFTLIFKSFNAETLFNCLADAFIGARHACKAGIFALSYRERAAL